MGSGVNDVFHGITVMHDGGQVAQESSRESILVGHGKAMSMKEDLVFDKPIIEQSISLKLPKRKGGANVEVEANNVAVVIVRMLVHRDANAIYILGEFITGRDVIFHGDAAKKRCQIDWEDAVLVVDILESL